MAEIGEFVKSNGAVAGVVIIVAVNTVGVSYNHGVFGAQGFSYLDFATTSDFLLAAFRSPIVLIYIGGLFLFSARNYTEEKVKIAEFVRSRRILLFVPSAFFVFVGTPAFLGAIISEYSLSNISENMYVNLVLGSQPNVKVTCEINSKEGKRSIKVFSGVLMSEASDVYLLKLGDSSVIISKSCVKFIERELV